MNDIKSLTLSSLFIVIHCWFNHMLIIVCSFIVGAPRGSVNGATNTPPGIGIYNFPYGVVYNCPVDIGVCGGFNDTGGILYDNTGMLLKTY